MSSRSDLAEVLAHLHLDAVDAPLDDAGHLRHQLVFRVVRPAAAAVDRHRLGVGPQELVERQAQGLGLQVPQPDVHGGDRAEGHALPAVAPHGPEHVVPELLDVERVLADQQLLEPVLHDLPGPGDGAREPQALGPGVRVDVDEELASSPGAGLERGDGRVLDGGRVRVEKLGRRDVGDLQGALQSESPLP